MVEAVQTTSKTTKMPKRVTLDFPEADLKSESSKQDLVDALKSRIQCQFNDAIAKLQKVIQDETSLDVTKDDFMTGDLSLKTLWLLNQLIKTKYQSGRYQESQKMTNTILDHLNRTDTGVTQE